VIGASGASAVTGANVTRLVDGSADSLSILLLDGTTGGTTLVTPSLANEETLTIGESGTDSTAAVTFALGTVTATDLTTLYITGSNNHTMTLSGETLLATVDASAATGTLNIAGGNSAVNMTVTGTPSTAMSIVGGSGNDSITAGAAADSITGGNGNDTIIGNAGNDTIIGGLGIDSLVGGDGTDTISAAYTLSTDGGSVTATGVVINLSSSAVLATTIAGYKTTGAGVIVLGVNSDISSVASGTSVNLGTSANVATTSSRVDTLSGFENIQGSTGTDYLIGSSSANTITGGTGADVMVGGSGADTFAGVGTTGNSVAGTSGFTATIAATDAISFTNGVDVITDFVSGTDFLDVTTAGVAPTTLVGQIPATTALTIGTTYFLRGGYVASTGVFTGAAAGADLLMVTAAAADATVAALAAETGWVVLVGVTALVAADLV
jgi:Ca2+-binding RTX toxin-like protein